MLNKLHQIIIEIQQRLRPSRDCVFSVCVCVFLRLLYDTPAPGAKRRREAPKEKS